MLSVQQWPNGRAKLEPRPNRCDVSVSKANGGWVLTIFTFHKCSSQTIQKEKPESLESQLEKSIID